MMPTVISIDGPADVDTVADRVAEVLRGGGSVVLPTDTVYGLAALPTDAPAIERVFELKGRGTDTPLAVLCADHEQAASLVRVDTEAVVHAVGERWWPGPLTLVAPRRAGVHLHLGEPSTTVGVRVPDDPLVRAIAERVGPIAATSANRHGAPTPSDAREAATSLLGEVGLVIDGGERAVSASTVIDVGSAPWTVLRAGPIDPADVLAMADAFVQRDR